MAEERKIQLSVVTDATRARAGFEEVKAGARDMAQGVQQAGQQAAQGVDAIAAGGDAAAQKLDRSTRSIVTSIQRATAAAEAGGQSNARFFESLAKQRGANTDALRPYLVQLDEAQRKSLAANQSLAVMDDGLLRTGMSAKQTAAALRGLPAQFTDIFTSLAAGQNPLTVLLQQGGQLKDMFGGVGPAAQALGGYIAGMVNPITLSVAALGALGVAWAQGDAEMAEYRKSLILTGNAIGLTATQLQDLAAQLSADGGTQSGAADILNKLVSDGAAAREQLGGVADAIGEMSRAGMGDVESLVKTFAKLREDPVTGIKELQKAYNFLTPEVYAQIKALEVEGRTEEAAALAQRTAAAALKARAKEVQENAGLMEKSWNSVKKAAAEAWDSMMNVGRKDRPDESLTQQIEKQKSLIADLERAAIGDVQPWETISGSLPAARAYLQTLQEKLMVDQRNAEVTRDAAKAQDEYQKTLDRVSDSQKKGREQSRGLADALKDYYDDLAALRATTPTSPALDPAAIAAGEAAIRKQFESITNAASKGAAKMREESTKLLAELGGLSTTFYEDWAQLDKMFAAGQFGQGAEAIQRLSDAQGALLAKQPRIREETNMQARAQADLEKSTLALGKAMESVVEASARQVEGLQTENERMAEQIETAGMGAEELVRYKVAKLQAAAAAAEFAAAELDSAAATLETLKQLPEVAAQYRALAKAKRDYAEQAIRQSDLLPEAEAARRAAEEWQRTAQSIEQSLTDALMRGFENGKGFGENMRDVIVNMFKTMVLRPLVQPIVQGATGSIMGMLGMGGTAGQGAAGTGAGGIMDYLSTGSSLYNAYTGGGVLGAIYGSTAAYGAAIGGGSIAAGSQAALLASQTAAFGAEGLAATGTAAAYAGGTAGAAGSAMASLAAVAPYLAAVVAILAMIDWGGGTPHMGGAYVANTDGTGFRATDQNTPGFGLSWGAYRDNADRSSAMDEAVKTFAEGFAGSAASAFAGLGLDSRLSVATKFSSDGDEDSRGAIRIRDVTGRTLADVSGKYDEDAAKGLQEFAADAGKALRDALVGADLPGWADKALAALGDAPQLESVLQLAEQLAQVRAGAADAAGQLGLTAEQMDGVMSASDNLAATLSGVAAMTDPVSAAIQKYTGQQQVLAAEFERLGFSVLPTSTMQLRDMLGTLDLTTESGRATAASLLELVPAMYGMQNASLQLIGTSADALKGIILQGLTGQQTADQMAAALQSTLLVGIQNAMAGSTAQTITQLMLGGIVQPAVQAILAGGSIASALSADMVNATVAQIRAQVDAFVAVMADPRLQEVFALLTDGLSGVVGAVTSAPPQYSIPQIQVPQISIPAVQVPSTPVSSGGGYDSSEANARNALISQYQQQASALEQLISRLESARDAIADFRAQIKYTDLSPLSPQEKLRQAEAEYKAILGKARLGDVDAMGQLQGASQTYLELARSYYGSSEAYARIFDQVDTGLGAVETVADRQLAVQKDQLTAVERQIEQLRAVASSSTQSVYYSQQTATYAQQSRDYAQQTYTYTSTAQATTLTQVRDAILAIKDEVIWDELKAINATIAAIVDENMLVELQAIRANLKAQNTDAGIPAFAMGGDHLGGLRIVGERGPELEATGPARIWTFEQTRALLEGGSQPRDALTGSDFARHIGGLARVMQAGFAELVAENRAMRARLDALESRGRIERARARA